MNKFLTTLFLFIGLLIISSCSKSSENKSNDNRPFILCTTGMIQDAVKNTVGSQAEVKALMGPGVDPHLYKATQGDLKAIRRADIIVYNGLHLEGKLIEIFKSLKAKKTIIALGDGVPQEAIIYHGNTNAAADPHIWFDVKIWSKAVDYLASELKKNMAEHEELIDKNHSEYRGTLDSLDAQVKEILADIPQKSRVLITAHDAFSYFGRAYNFQVEGAQGISTVDEYGIRDIQKLVDLIIKRNIKAIFLESSVPERAINKILEGAQDQGHSVKIGGTLYSDALGPAHTNASFYQGMVLHNAKTIKMGLLGK